MKLNRLLLAMVLPLAACEVSTNPIITDPDAPGNLTYQLIPSGDPDAPLGVLLSWDVPSSGRANAFNVYGRESTGSNWELRATTTSPRSVSLATSKPGEAQSRWLTATCRSPVSSRRFSQISFPLSRLT